MRLGDALTGRARSTSPKERQKMLYPDGSPAIPGVAAQVAGMPRIGQLSLTAQFQSSVMNYVEVPVVGIQRNMASLRTHLKLPK